MLSSTGKRMGMQEAHAKPNVLRHPLQRTEGEVVDVIRMAEAAPATAVDHAVDAAEVRHADLGATVRLQHARDFSEETLRLCFVFDHGTQDHPGKETVGE